MLERIFKYGIVALIAATPASAADQGTVTSQAMVLSFGTSPCGDFVAAPAQNQQLYEAWAMGFISGENVMDESDMRFTGNGWTPDSVMAWLQNYCSQNPLAAFVGAAGELRGQLAKQEGFLPKLTQPATPTQQGKY